MPLWLLRSLTYVLNRCIRRIWCMDAKQLDLLIVVAPGAFAMLMLCARKLGGVRAAAGFSIVWLAAACAVVFLTLPPADMPLHSFERSPVPGIVASLTGTLAGLSWTFWKDPGTTTISLRSGLQIASVYAFTSLSSGLLA